MTAPRCSAPTRTNGARHRVTPPRRLPVLLAPTTTERATAAAVQQLRHLLDVPRQGVVGWAILLAGVSLGAVLMMILLAACDPPEPPAAPVSGPAVQLQPVDPRS